MKRNDINDIKEKIFFQNYENLFHVYATTDGDYFYNILRKINIPEEISKEYYSEYIVLPGDTWTLIAHNHYNDVKLWWLICIANGIRNPLEFPKAGTPLKLFSPTISQNILMLIKGT